MNMKALISKIEPVESGYRVAQVESNENIFPVAVDLEWVDCPDNIEKDYYWYDPADGQFKLNPFYIVPEPSDTEQPQVSGAQTL